MPLPEKTAFRPGPGTTPFESLDPGVERAPNVNRVAGQVLYARRHGVSHADLRHHRVAQRPRPGTRHRAHRRQERALVDELAQRGFQHLWTIRTRHYRLGDFLQVRVRSDLGPVDER